VQGVYAQWRGAGGDPGELFARYGLTLSIAGLKDPARPPLELIRQAAAAGERVADPRLREALAIRLILSLVSSGNRAEALAVYDRERQRFPLDGLTRELERRRIRRLARLPRAAAASWFRLRGSARGRLLLSPSPIGCPTRPTDLAIPGAASCAAPAGTAPQHGLV
jgi:hypothetical protein